MLEINQVYQGDSAQLLKQIDDKIITLTVTSPPYDNLRDYKGYSFDFENIAKELYRITKEGGVVVWIIGDATINGSETGTSFRQALYFMECGFNLHDTMIYSKNNPIPLNHNRYEQKFEYMFVFCKGKLITFNPLMDKCKYHDTSNKPTYRHSSEGILKPCNTPQKIKEFKIKSNIWGYDVGANKSTKDKFAYKHPAIFPEQLAKDHILSWSNKGDIILDPFTGSGTTLKIAKQLNRKFIGIEIEKSYVDIAERRLCQNTLSEVSGKDTRPFMVGRNCHVFMMEKETNYKKEYENCMGAHNILMDYWDDFPEDIKPEIDKRLKEVGL